MEQQDFEIPQEAFNKQVAVAMALQDLVLDECRNASGEELSGYTCALTSAIHGLGALTCPLGMPPMGDPMEELESLVDDRIKAALADDST